MRVYNTQVALSSSKAFTSEKSAHTRFHHSRAITQCVEPSPPPKPAYIIQEKERERGRKNCESGWYTRARPISLTRERGYRFATKCSVYLLVSGFEKEPSSLCVVLLFGARVCSPTRFELYTARASCFG